MSDQKTKTIQINPALFSLAANKTARRGNKTKGSSQPIKVKTPPVPKNNSTLKRNLLHLFRKHYDDKQKEQDHGTAHQEVKGAPKTDLEDSIEYLRLLTEKQNQPPDQPHKPTIKQTFIHNQTLKRHDPYVANNMNLPPTFVMNTAALPVSGNYIKPPLHQVPQYGCMKNGTLPTYKVWKHSTQRNNSTIPNIPKPSHESIVQQNIPVRKFDEHIQKQLEQISLRQQRQQINTKYKKEKQDKQKRICRRTYHVGKSKQHPLISVLVSNRTIRNNTNLKLSKLKNTPMPEVKKYLLKNGFIKTGSNTPTDVLRQMFESASLICGELKNRNPDNLLYNYFNEPV